MAFPAPLCYNACSKPDKAERGGWIEARPIHRTKKSIHMKRVKITVLKTTLDQELAAEYGVEGLTACPMLKAGQVFHADYAKPDGLCDEAWKAIYQYVFALAHGAEKELFYYGDWIRRPGVAICSCNDGLRPVIFKLEATDEVSQIDYTPVR